MIKSKEDLLASINELSAENLEDKVLALLEDVSDTLDSLSEVEAKLKDLDESWKKRYRERFLKGEPPDTANEDEKEDAPKVKDFKDLFVEVE